MKRERKAEEEKRHADARKEACLIWAEATHCSSHPYLTRKGIEPNGTRLYKNSLVIPVRIGGVIHSLQFISEDGSKRFLAGGRKAGCYYSIGKMEDARALCIGEGFATAATIRQASGYPTVAAFDAGNLLSVAKTMRERFPNWVLFICADDDHHTKGNPGIRKAQEAAMAVNGVLVIPDFGDNRPYWATDFNDLAKLHGAEAVKLSLLSASEKGKAQHQPDQNNSAQIDPGASFISPEPLPSLPNVKAFDYAYLPTTLCNYVKDISERMQCPTDFAAVGVLVMIVGIVGRKVGIRPMKNNDWTVIPNLWGAVVGNSGIMKSPTLNDVLMPIKKLQAQAFEKFDNENAEYETNAELVKIQKSVDKSKARKALKGNNSADALKILNPDETSDAENEPPVLKRYMTNNASYQALGELLRENPNGLLVEADELVGLLKQLDANGQEVARSFYLTAADGNQPYTFDRIMRGKGLHIDALCLSIIGGIQLGVLAEYVRQATGGGVGADGLLQRFGLMVYPDINPEWQEVDRFPNKEARESVTKLAEKMDGLKPFEIGTEQDPYGGVPFLRFDDEAQALFSEWRGELEKRLRSGEDHPAIVSHLSKYRKLIPSLALLFHLCDIGHGAVSYNAILSAIAFGEYIESHAQRIYSYATRTDIDAAKTLLKRLSRGKLKAEFKARDIYRAGWAGLETPTKAQNAINLLLEYNHLFEEVRDTGERPTTYYRWNKGTP